MKAKPSVYFPSDFLEIFSLDFSLLKSSPKSVLKILSTNKGRTFSYFALRLRNPLKIFSKISLLLHSFNSLMFNL